MYLSKTYRKDLFHTWMLDFLWIVGVIDVPDLRGMFLSRKWVANLERSIQLEKVINLNTMFIDICIPLIAHFLQDK